ncbi:hypothetical protein F443_13136 [Phytophthora nicotianae P1569]|uniref:Uncharacterized protein n=2 Tax=Phytophthora nicotianae TaxID=4792 RepID=V9ES13_PHYNI|nr:hypothetical protein F443_13136 [Phytophthora nicotianae P1569]
MHLCGLASRWFGSLIVWFRRPFCRGIMLRGGELFRGYGIGFGPPDDSLQTYLRKIEVRAPGLIDQDARQLSL